MSIQLNGINCFYGAHQALFDITLDCPQGETLVLLGPSGAGKSSLLRVLNLLEMPRSGTLNIAGNANKAATPLVSAEVRENPGIYPPADVRAKLFTLKVQDPKIDRVRTRAWTKVKSGK